MRRGTTPTIKFSLPFDVELVKEIWLTVSQRSREILTKSLEDMSLEDSPRMVSFQLTQEDTLLLDDGCKAEIQARILTVDGDAFASQIKRVEVEDILKDGVI